MNISIDKYKDELIQFLYKELYIKEAIEESTFSWLTARRLWIEAKTYYKDNDIICGGGYASWGNHITVSLRIDDSEMIRFNLKINELIAYERNKKLKTLI